MKLDSVQEMLLKKQIERLNKKIPYDEALRVFKALDKGNKGVMPIIDFQEIATSFGALLSQDGMDLLAEKYRIEDKSLLNYKKICKDMKEQSSPSSLNNTKKDEIENKNTIGSNSTSRPSLLNDKSSSFISNLKNKTPQNSPHKLIKKTSQLSQSQIHQELENEMILKQNIRYKFINNGSINGYKVLHNIFIKQDTTGDGYIKEKLFNDILDQSLKKKLTNEEKIFLIEHIRSKKDKNYLDYEQIKLFLIIDSDNEDDIASLSLNENINNDQIIKQYEINDTNKEISLGGAEYLVTERKLQQFLKDKPIKPMKSKSRRNSFSTGAHVILHYCEKYDIKNNNALTGKLSYEGIRQSLEKSGLILNIIQLRSILSKFTCDSQGFVNYNDFLKRYGFDPIEDKALQKVKNYVKDEMIDISIHDADPLKNLRSSFEKVDTLSNGTVSGKLNYQEFRKALDLAGLDLTANESIVLAQKSPVKQKSNKIDTSVDYMKFLKTMVLTQTNADMESLSPTKSSLKSSIKSPSNKLINENTTNDKKIYDKVHDFLICTKEDSPTLYEVVQSGFESADKIRNKKLCGMLSDTVLKTVGLNLSENEKKSMLNKLQGIGAYRYGHANYVLFLRHYASTMNSTKSSKNLQDSMRYGTFDVKGSVGEYLLHSSTQEEKDNFEKVMEHLKNMQKDICIESSNGTQSIRAENNMEFEGNNIIFPLGPNLKLAFKFTL